jgi:hypothetical protein
MKYVLFVSVFAAVLHFSSESVFACSCPTVGPYGYVEGKLKSSSAAFSGEVLSIVSDGNRRKVTFKVLEFWKGRLTSEFTVSTDLLSSSCRFDFEVGKKYLVFSSLGNGEQYTGACSGNRELQKAREELEILGKGKLMAPRAKRQ